MADQQTTQKGADRSEARESEGTERVREVIRDSFYTMLGAASWAFEKTDEMAQSWLHQGRTSGDENRRRFDEVCDGPLDDAPARLGFCASRRAFCGGRRRCCRHRSPRHRMRAPEPAGIAPPARCPVAGRRCTRSW